MTKRFQFSVLTLKKENIKELKFLLAFLLFGVLLFSVPSSIQAETQKSNSDILNGKREYDWNSVYNFAVAQNSLAENIVEKNANPQNSALLFKDQKEKVSKYRYIHNGITIEYLETPYKKIIGWARFDADIFPENMRSKNNVFKKFGIKGVSMKTDVISLESDGMTVKLNFKGNELLNVEISNFID